MQKENDKLLKINKEYEDNIKDLTTCIEELKNESNNLKNINNEERYNNEYNNKLELKEKE